jgi:hypothetical protein
MTVGPRAGFWTTLAGVLLLQFAWILVLPPFGGIDEHEHAFKAAAVARGDFSPHHAPSGQGWGEFVTVPSSLAEAAQPQCAILQYTYSDNCVGFANPDGTTRIASSAARYNPAYYAVVGTIGRIFTGDAALYAMRIASSLICALLIAAAFYVTRSSSRSAWPPVALLLGLTPTAIYSTSLVAPNGIEICGGVLLWCCLIALRSDAPQRLRSETLLALAALSSIPLLTVRTLGPLWWVLTVAGALLIIGLPRLRQLGRLRAARVFVGISAVAGAFGLGWSLIAHSNSLGTESSNDGSPWPGMFPQWLLWFFQTIAAAPLRNEYVPIVVYAITLTIAGLTSVLALRSASRRLRVALLYILATSTAVGIGTSVASYAAAGYAWQGRYFYPFAVGFFVILGAALDRRAPGLTISARFAALPIGLGLAATHVISQIAVRNRGIRSSPLVESGAWHVPSSALLIAITVIGTALLVLAAVAGRDTSTASTRSAAEQALATSTR